MKRGQFEETIGALKTFVSTKYVSHIDYLIPIFVDLLEPVLVKPTLANNQAMVTLKDDLTMISESSTREELEEYRLKLKDFLKDEKAVKITKRSVHNVV